MKKIFITIAEFLESGGKLEAGRDIYDIHEQFIGEYQKELLTDTEHFKIETSVGVTYGRYELDKVKIEY